MKNKADAQVIKGMIFAGCSFTWGQGLYYYSNLPTIQEPPPDQYDPKLVTPAHIAFMESRRYPRIVANHFNTFELVHEMNGGSNLSAITYWNKYDGENFRQYFPLNEYSHLVFQLTQWQRNDFSFKFEGRDYSLPFHKVTYPPLDDVFTRYLQANGITLDDWIDEYIKKNLSQVKQFLFHAESHGVKTLLFTWPEEYLPYIKKDEWLMERLVTFNYKNKEYESIKDLMSNIELEIKHDYQNFEVPPKDHHPSLECHRIMAAEVIKRIEAMK
jgi:hypothetical protein